MPGRSQADPWDLISMPPTYIPGSRIEQAGFEPLPIVRWLLLWTVRAGGGTVRFVGTAGRFSSGSGTGGACSIGAGVITRFCVYVPTILMTAGLTSVIVAETPFVPIEPGP